MLNPLIPLSVEPFRMGEGLLGEIEAIKNARASRESSDRRLDIAEQEELRKKAAEQQLRKDRRLQSIGIAATQLKGMSPEERIAFLDAREAQIGQLREQGQDVDSIETQEFRALLSNPEQADAMLDMAIQQADRRGLLNQDSRRLDILQQQADQAATSDVKTSGMSKIFSDGTSLQLFNDGSRVVTMADGSIAEGEEAETAITEGRTADIQEQLERSAGRKQGSENEGRDSDLINRGVALAESTATLRRGIELLQKVETGGPEAVSLRAKQAFGVETADEGELSSALGKAVLSQLRETFGAQFTETEGSRLERIEANFGKSNAANIRLLNQALRVAERTAQRARTLASDKGLESVVADIDDLLTFSLSIPEDIDETDIFSQADAIIGN